MSNAGLVHGLDEWIGASPTGEVRPMPPPPPTLHMLDPEHKVPAATRSGCKPHVAPILVGPKQMLCAVRVLN